jgi:hypothetical protein
MYCLLCTEVTVSTLASGTSTIGSFSFLPLLPLVLALPTVPVAGTVKAGGDK